MKCIKKSQTVVFCSETLVFFDLLFLFPNVPTSYL
nr:MAG TPA: hypothetical protein [Caudoviricetes sp.]